MSDMEIESSQESLDAGPLTLRNLKKLKLSNEAESFAFEMTNKRSKKVQYNNIDPNNNASRYQMGLKTKEFGDFYHFVTKNQNRDEKKGIFEEVRELAQERNIELNGRIKDKLQRSRMIVRVISKQQSNNQIVFIQDQTGKQKMQVNRGTVWIGMIACMDLSFDDGCYKMQQVYDLSLKFQNINPNAMIKEPFSAYRMVFIKGSFSRLDSRQSPGLRILINQLKVLVQRQKVKIDTIVILGPILHRKNTALKSGFSELTYQEETRQLIRIIKDQISNINSEISLIFVPSTDDLTNHYPIPQPKYSSQIELEADNIFYTSNPGLIHLSSARQAYQINVINYDILEYIDQCRTGRPVLKMKEDNIQSYFKQPFYITNALNEPFDETNLPGVYNAGKFGHIIVISSYRDHPYAVEIRGRLFVNIGSLGIDESNLTNKHYMTLVSIYDGEGPVSKRVKVESMTMEK